MGRLYRSDGIVCTGTLIGPRHVTTAKHCIPSGGSVSIKFQPAYDGKDRFPSAYVTDVLAPAAGTSDQVSHHAHTRSYSIEDPAAQHPLANPRSSATTKATGPSWSSTRAWATRGAT